MNILIGIIISIVIMVIFFIQMDFQYFLRHHYPKLAKWVGWNDEPIFSTEAFVIRLFHPLRLTRLLFSSNNRFILKNNSTDLLDEYANLVSNKKYKIKKRIYILSSPLGLLLIFIISNLMQ